MSLSIRFGQTPIIKPQATQPQFGFIRDQQTLEQYSDEFAQRDEALTREAQLRDAINYGGVVGERQVSSPQAQVITPDAWRASGAI